MKYPGPIRPEPSPPPSPGWWSVLLTFLCAGGLLLIYWLSASHIVNADTITLGVVITGLSWRHLCRSLPLPDGALVENNCCLSVS